MVSTDETRELDMPIRHGLRLLVTMGLSADDPETLPSSSAEYDPSNSEGDIRAGINQRRSVDESRVE